MKYFRLLFVITFFTGIFVNHPPIIDVLFQGVALVLMLAITRQYRIKNHIAKYIVLLTYWVSMVMMPSFHLVINQTGDFSITQQSYDRISTFGSRIILLTTLTWGLLAPLWKREIKQNFEYVPRPISKFTVKISLVIMFGLSLFSFSIGLSRMGAEQVELPFHLSGIITLLRSIFYPILFAVFVENFILTRRKFPKKYYLLFFAWSVVEIFVRLSKSVLLSSFLTLMLVLYMYYRPSIKSIVRTLAPFVVFFLFLYPIVETMRGMSGMSLKESFMESRKIVSSDDDSDRILAPLNRTFMMPQMFAKDYSYISENEFFDFSKAPIVVAWKGAARYQTFVIDGYPPEVNHSSGTTGLQDPLLHGGYGLCYFMIVLIVIMACAIDRMAQNRQYSIYIRLMLFLWGFCNSQNITTLYDSVGLQAIFIQIVAILIAYFYNFQRKKEYSIILSKNAS